MCFWSRLNNRHWTIPNTFKSKIKEKNPRKVDKQSFFLNFFTDIEQQTAQSWNSERKKKSEIQPTSLFQALFLEHCPDQSSEKV